MSNIFTNNEEGRQQWRPSSLLLLSFRVLREAPFAKREV